MSDAVPAAGGHETGLVAGDERRHAARRRLTGRYAACGAGRIAVTLMSRFRGRDPMACLECARLFD